MIDNDLTDINEILTILMEECAEVQVEASKLMRFPENSSEKLEKEIGDLMYMVEVLHQWDLVSFTKIDEQMTRKHDKLKKYSHFMGETNEGLGI